MANKKPTFKNQIYSNCKLVNCALISLRTFCIIKNYFTRGLLRIYIQPDDKQSCIAVFQLPDLHLLQSSVFF